MDVVTSTIDDDVAAELLNLSESHFVDLKAVEISPAKLTKAFSAFANASGGEVFVGIGEYEGAEGIERQWNGFPNEEAANPIF